MPLDPDPSPRRRPAAALLALGTLALAFPFTAAALPFPPAVTSGAASAAPATGSDTPPPTLDRARDLHVAGRLDEALAAYRAFTAASAGRAPADEAAAHNNACVILIDYGDLPAALGECEAALALRRQEEGDERGLGRTLNNLGLALQRSGRYRESDERFGEALAINRRLGDVQAQAINLANLGGSATYEGRYTAALAHLHEAGALAAEHRDEPWAAEQVKVARLNQGVVLEKLGAYHEALALYRGLLGTGEPDAEGDTATTGTAAVPLDARTRATLEVNTGTLYRNLGDPVRAVAAYDRAIATYRTLEDLSGLSNAYLNRALAFDLNLARPRAGEADFRRALELARVAGDRSEEIQDLFHLGRLLVATGRLDEAEAVFTDCLAAARESGSAEGTWSGEEGLGRIAEARGDLAGALAHLERALGEIERVRARVERGELRSGYFGDKRAVYAAAVRVLAALAAREPAAGHEGRALAVAERAKARDLLDALGPGGGSSLTARPLGPAELAELAGRAGGPILDYFVGEGTLYRWTIRPGGVEMAAPRPAAPVLAAVVTVHRALAAGGEPSADALGLLSAALLAGAGPLPTAGGPLRISADGALGYLPFELLVPPDGAGADGRPLVERAALSYLPSASALAGLARPVARPARELVGFGDPALRPEGEASPAGLLVARFHLGPLPAAAAELAAVARALPGRAEIRLGAEATEGAFRRAVADGARVVHLVTHTVIDERPGRGAAILLAPEGDDDGLLDPAEIARLGVHAELTVLAACSTAPGDAEGGRALTSLTGSFLAAGSGAVVATLWDVGDRATAVFMAQLYARLGRGLSPAAALAETKRALRADPGWSRPDLWSAYVLVGDAGPVVGWWRRLPAGVWLALAAALAAVAAALLVTRTRRSRPTA